jgi:hypothetical protein
VSGRADPRGPVNVDADVALRSDFRLARVHAHPNSTRPALRSQGCLRVGRGGERRSRAPEGDQERVPLRVHLVPVVARERLAKQPAVRCQRLAIGRPEPAQERGRAFHVREEQRDGAGRQGVAGGWLAAFVTSGHLSSVRPLCRPD